MRRARRQLGFTLIELMMVVAIIGILSAVAIPTFVGFMNKGRSVEAIVAIDMMLRDVQVYHITHDTLPPSSGILPAVSACATGTGKTPATPPATWSADPGFQALGFAVIEPGFYQYSWTRASPTDGTAFAQADFHCSGVMSTTVATATIIAGNVMETSIADFVEQ